MKYVAIIILFLAYTACSTSSKGKDDSEDSIETALAEAQNDVTVMTLKRSDFHHESISNGKIEAMQYADLRFSSPEVIESISVRNGDAVRKGQKIAELSSFRLRIKTAQAREALDRAMLDLQDVLIGQGYVPADSAKIPDSVMKLARTRSGFDQARTQYEAALYEEEHAVMTAPFDGVIANLFAKPFNMASTTDLFCTVIGSGSMEASFTVLESELGIIRKNDRVRVSPYFSPAEEGMIGHISEINPVIDSNGMAKLRAAVQQGTAGRLYEGMNVWVGIQHTVADQLVVPKQAVVIRSGKQVVFTLTGEKAYWNYVSTGLENSTSYTVVDGLKEGDVVITGGNINLAHESTVRVAVRAE